MAGADWRINGRRIHQVMGGVFPVFAQLTMMYVELGYGQEAARPPAIYADIMKVVAEQYAVAKSGQRVTPLKVCVPQSGTAWVPIETVGTRCFIVLRELGLNVTRG